MCEPICSFLKSSLSFIKIFRNLFDIFCKNSAEETDVTLFDNPLLTFLNNILIWWVWLFSLFVKFSKYFKIFQKIHNINKKMTFDNAVPQMEGPISFKSPTNG